MYSRMSGLIPKGSKFPIGMFTTSVPTVPPPGFPPANHKEYRGPALPSVAKKVPSSIRPSLTNGNKPEQPIFGGKRRITKSRNTRKSKKSKATRRR